MGEQDCRLDRRQRRSLLWVLNPVVIVVFVQRTLTTFDVTAPTYVSAQQIIRQPLSKYIRKSIQYVLWRFRKDSS